MSNQENFQKESSVPVPRVVVIGGGLAGIAAAETLARAKFQVTLIESSSQLGGKVSGSRRDGRDYEHGIHGFWPNYLNLFALLERANLTKTELFEKSSGTTTFVPGVGSYFNSPLRFSIPAPFHIVLHLFNTQYLSWIDKISLFHAAIDMIAFDHQEDYAEYDALTFRGWLWSKGVSAKAYARLLEPFARALTFDSSSRVSTAAVLSAFQLYLLRGQADIEPYWLKQNPAGLFESLESYLKSLGVEILYQTEAKKLVYDEGGWISSICYQAKESQLKEGGDFQEICRVAEADIADGEIKTIEAPPYKPIHIRRVGRNLIALDSTCTHAANITQIDAQRGFVCLAHHSTFDLEGNPTGGDAKRCLFRYNTLPLPEGGWVIRTQEAFCYKEVDYVISAIHLDGFRQLMTPELLEKPFFAGIENLETTPVIVGRFWFQGKINQPTFASGFFTGDSIVDTYFVVPSCRPDETVIEAQAYLVRDVMSLDVQAIETLMHRDLIEAFPELKGRSYTHPPAIQIYPKLFSLFEAGSDASRPSIETPIPNLFLAGDWVHVDFAVWNMERAVFTGIRAAEALLKKYGRNPSASEDTAYTPPQVLPDPGRVYRFIRMVAKFARRVSRAYLNFRRGKRREPFRLRNSFKPPDPSGAQKEPVFKLICEVRKYVGTPREETVRGTLAYRVTQEPTLIFEPPISRLQAEFEVDLSTISTRNKRRDNNLRSLFLRTQTQRFVKISILDFVPSAKSNEKFKTKLSVKVGYDSPIEVEGDVFVEWIGPTYQRGILRVLTVARPSQFGFFVGALNSVCLAEDFIKISASLNVTSELLNVGQPIAEPKPPKRIKKNRQDNAGILPQGAGDDFLGPLDLPYERDRPEIDWPEEGWPPRPPEKLEAKPYDDYKVPL